MSNPYEFILAKPMLTLRDDLIRLMLVTTLLFLAAFSQPSFGSSKINNTNTGTIQGTVYDAENDEPLAGVNVIIEGTTMGAATDMNGKFVINSVPVGKYNVVIRMIGFTKVILTDVVVNAGKVTMLEKVSLKLEAIGLGEVVVEARFIQNNEAAMLKDRQQADAISDGLSAEAISRTGSSQAAEAMRQVTGASVVDGKYVYVRGLGERYASTQLNGVELPSADPDKRSFQMDLIPAKMLDNIIATKTFTPDQPGNFSGGIVNLGMRTFPESFHFSFSTGVSWNSQSTFNSNFLGYDGGRTDWLGVDDGTREMPGWLNNETVLPSEFQARRNADLANSLDQASKSFTPIMSPVAKRAPIDRNFSISMGNQSMLFGRPIGYLGSLSYRRDYSFRDNGRIARWKLTGSVAGNDSLNNLIKLSDSRGMDEVLWGGMATFNYQPFDGHQIRFNLLRSQSGTSEARYLVGPWPEQNVQFFETRALKYTERGLTSWQVQGDHKLPMGLKMEWTGTLATTSQDEPDARFFSDTFANRTVAGRDTIIYSISPSIIQRPARYFRDLTEDSRAFQFSVKKEFKLWNSEPTKIKFGGNYEEKDRQFHENLFEYYQGAGFRFTGDAGSFFSDKNVGIIDFDSSRNQFLFGNYIQDGHNVLGGNYWGDQIIRAGFFMLDLPLSMRLRLIGGVRFESTRMNVANEDESGKLHDNDWLPSVNVLYRLTKNLNMRLAYGRTLARPNFREKAPYASFEFANDFIFNGNTALERTRIDNYDLRWDWFMQSGELVSLSAFYKSFENPIERVINVFFSSEGALVYFDNVDQAKVYGLEFEVRKRLEMFSPSLRDFTLSANLSLIKSEVTIPNEELVIIRGVDPNAKAERELQGQSPFLINLNLTYDNLAKGTTMNLYYNVFGERLSEVSLGGTPNVFEKPFHMLNFNASKRIFQQVSLKFAVKNLLNQSHEFVHHYKGTDYTRQFYKTGRSISFGVNYDFK